MREVRSELGVYFNDKTSFAERGEKSDRAYVYMHRSWVQLFASRPVCPSSTSSAPSTSFSPLLVASNLYFSRHFYLPRQPPMCFDPVSCQGCPEQTVAGALLALLDLSRLCTPASGVHRARLASQRREDRYLHATTERATRERVY